MHKSETPSEKSRGAGCLPAVAALVVGAGLVAGYAGRANAAPSLDKPAGTAPADWPADYINPDKYEGRHKAWHLLGAR